MPAIHSRFNTVPGSVHTDPVPDATKVVTAAASLNSTQMLAHVGMTVLVVALFVVVVVLISTAVYRGPRIMHFAAALYRSNKEGDGTEVADSNSNDITTSKPKNMEKRSKLKQEIILPVTVAPSVAAAAAAALITLPPPVPAHAPPRYANATSLVRYNAISLRPNPPPRRALKAPVPPPLPSASPTIFKEIPSVPEALVPTPTGPPIKLRIQVHELPARSLGADQDGPRVKKEVVKPTEEVQKELKLVMMGAFDSDASVSTTASAVTITYDSPTPMNGPVFESSPTRIRVRTLPTSGAGAQPIARTIIMDAFADMDPDASISTIASGISNESFLPMDGPVLVPVPAPIRVLSDVREQEAQLVMVTTPADFDMEPDISIASSASAITIIYNSPTPMNGPVFEPPTIPHCGDASDSFQSPESRCSSAPPRPANRLARYDTSGCSSASGEFPMDGCDLTMSSSGFSVAPHTFDPFATGMNRTSSPPRERPAPRAIGGVFGVVDINALRFKNEKNIKLEKGTPEGRLRGDTCGGGKENWLAAGRGGN